MVLSSAHPLRRKQLRSRMRFRRNQIHKRRMARNRLWNAFPALLRKTLPNPQLRGRLRQSQSVKVASYAPLNDTYIRLQVLVAAKQPATKAAPAI
jgi:hypothetical protein